MLETPIKRTCQNDTPLKNIIQAKLNTFKSNNNQKHFPYSQQKQSKVNNFTQQKQKQQLDDYFNKDYEPLFENAKQNSHLNNNQNNITLSIISDNQITQRQILQFQSKQNPGFYEFNNWIQLNRKLFANVDQLTVTNLWKILRILNYGQVLIPTGLIFQLSKSLINKKTKIGNLRNIFNNFFKINQINQKVQNFRQLGNYPTLQSIQNKYLNINIESTSKKNSNSYQKKQRTQSCNFKTKQSHQQQQNVFDRIYKESYKRNQKRNQQTYKSITKQLSNCKFKPQINSYNKKLFQSCHQNYVKPQRICHHKQKWKTRKQNEQALIVYGQFKASKVDKSIYQSVIQDIPGVRQHISRSKYSTAQKQRIQRYLQKPTLVRNFY